MNKTLIETPQETWGNTILFKLAEALGRDYLLSGDITDPKKVYAADPDELLQEALDVIWMYKELSK